MAPAGAGRVQAAAVGAGSSRPWTSQLAEEARTVSELSGTADAREGLAAVIERRKPDFKGR